VKKIIYKILKAGVLLFLLKGCILNVYGEEKMKIYVSKNGNDSWSGRIPEPDKNLTDGPFKTLERAIKEIQEIKKKKSPEESIIIEIDGTYQFDKKITLSSDVSGNPSAPLIIKGKKGVIFNGGIEIKKWEKIKEKEILDKLNPEARKYVLRANLKDYGINDFGDFFQPNWYNSSGSQIQLYFNGKPMKIARWPDEGFSYTGEITGNGKFIVNAEKERIKNWQKEKKLKAFGYWFYEWASQHMDVEKVDPDSGVISLKNPESHSYGYKKGAMFFIYNALCELDSPGEWFIDEETGYIYFYPPDDIEKGKAIVSVNKVPFIEIKGASNIKIENIVFENSRKEGILISECENITISNCIFRNLGGWAIKAFKVKNTRIENCEIYFTGEGGIYLEGGDRKTLTPGNNEITNNHIHDFSLWMRVYRPAIQINGVGNRVANNLIHDAPHMAIGWSGNENIIEYNEIYNVVLETNDAGAIYSGRDPSMQGNIIRYNYFHDIGKLYGLGVASVYLDDGHCGNIVYGNIFYRACKPGYGKFGAVFIHGGRYNLIENNIFLECEQAYNETPWDQERWKKTWTEEYRERLFGNEIDVRKPPYSEKYPWLINILEDTRPNILKRNIVYKCKGFIDRGKVELIDNLVEVDPLFENYTPPYLKFKKDSPVFKIGFKEIPFEKIGLKKEGKNEICN
jgi:hypothetical protein